MLRAFLSDHLDELVVASILGMMWIKGIVHDAAADRAAWVIADIAIPPLGILRGLVSFLA